MSEHSPTPWTSGVWDGHLIYSARGNCITSTGIYEKADAEFIVRACNAHDDLLAALEGLVKFDSYESEYDGQMITKCPSCGALLDETEHGEHCAFTAARAAIAKAKGND